MATETVKEILDETSNVLDEIGDQLDLIENGVQVVKGTKLVVGGMVVGALVVGAASTYFILNRKLKAKYEKISRAEIEEARLYFAQRNKTGEYADPAELAKKYEDEAQREEDLRTVESITRSYQSDDISAAHETIGEVTAVRDTPDGVEVDVTLEPEVINVFKQAETPGDFDYEEELKNRSEDAPYIITYDEWSTNESGYEQSTLTYFTGDDVLADSADKPIDETDDLVGDDNLLRFGHGSKDNNVVYIRNEIREIEFEVVRSPNKYAAEVLGFLEHSARDKRARKFRDYDD